MLHKAIMKPSIDSKMNTDGTLGMSFFEILIVKKTYSRTFGNSEIYCTLRFNEILTIIPEKIECCLKSLLECIDLLLLSK